MWRIALEFGIMGLFWMLLKNRMGRKILKSLLKFIMNKVIGKTKMANFLVLLNMSKLSTSLIRNWRPTAQFPNNIVMSQAKYQALTQFKI